MLNTPRIADTTGADIEAPPSPTNGAGFEGSPAPAEAAGLERAQTLCDLRRFGDAVPVAGKAIAADPRNAGAWCLMARAQLGNDCANAALKAARAATSLAPDDDLPHRLESIALSRQGRDEEAVLAAREAILCAPSAWQGHAQLSHCLSGFRDQLEDARAAADRALALMPDDPGPHIAVGAVALAAGRRADATSAFCAALAVDPQCSEAHSQLADLQTRERAPAWRRLGARIRLCTPS